MKGFVKNVPSKSNFIRTSIPTVYTLSSLEPDLDMNKNLKEMKLLFENAHTKYIPPSDFKYQLPTCGIPEFAFIGRSNVGKSSLVDILLGNKKIVRISKEPGCTKSINYYGICKDKDNHDSSNHLAYLVDLPGYGFAKTSKVEQDGWKNMIQSYLKNRNQSILRRAYILVDSRRGMKQLDIDMMHVLSDALIPYQIILTKSDLVNEIELTQSLETIFTAIEDSDGAATCMPFVHCISCLPQKQQQQQMNNRNGIDELKCSISEIYSHNWSQ